MNQEYREQKLLRITFQENKYRHFINMLQGQQLSVKLSVLFLAIITLAAPAYIAGRQILNSHASTSNFTNCVPIPAGLTQQQIQQLSQNKTVQWCQSANNITSVAALGDSITAGFTNCLSTASPATCPLEPNNYVYLYANSVLPANSQYFNFGYAGTTAACAGACPTNDQPNPQAFKNSYITNVVVLPNNESGIQTQANMENRTTPGIVRSNLGEFDNLSHAQVIVAWGRNDVDTSSISIQQYKDAISSIVARIKNNPSNQVILLTISPLDREGWIKNVPVSSRRTEFNDRIFDLTYPRELDSFFSAQEWEVAYGVHALIAPLSEYLWRNLPSTYLSTDHLHPSTAGYQVIASVLKNHVGTVTKNVVSLQPGAKFAIIARVPTYGEIVSQKNGQFYYSEPFYADARAPYIAKTITGDTTVYANGPVAISNTVVSDTEVSNFKINDLVVDSMTAYGKGWNWGSNGLPWVGNGFDLTTIGRFANGPCLGKAFGTCKFDTRAEFLINGQYVESITAYGKYWNFDLQEHPWASNGSDLTTVPRFASGPCKGKAPGTCVFTSRRQVFLPNGQWKEEVVAYGQTWDWDQNENLISTTSVTPTPTLSLDLNHDGVVNSSDYSYLVHCFGATAGHPTSVCANPSWADLNHDGIVNGIDFNLFTRLYFTK